MMTVTKITAIIGIHRYMKFNMLIADADCSGAFATYPPASSNKPQMAVPSPPPTLIPKDEQENIAPSICFPCVRTVYSEVAEISALISPVTGLANNPAIADIINIIGTFMA